MSPQLGRGSGISKSWLDRQSTTTSAASSVGEDGAGGSSRSSESGVTGRAVYASPEAVFRDHYLPLARALSVVAGNPELAEEAVQEAFSRLCRNWKKVSEYEDQVAWVRRVAINLIRDQRRSLRRQVNLLLRLERQPRHAHPPRTADPELWDAVRALPLKQRTAVALFYVADLSVDQTAEAMGVSRGSVVKHLDRARKRLKTMLEDVGNE